MIKVCEDCGREFDGTKNARYCKSCKMQRAAAGYRQIRRDRNAAWESISRAEMIDELNIRLALGKTRVTLGAVMVKAIIRELQK